MRVIEAEAMGMCFGVRDALAIARQMETPAQITVFGELVHNPQVMGDIALRGFAVLTEDRRTPENVRTQAVLITAHGISDRERRTLAAAGKVIHDATCPLVKKAHAAAVALARAGFFVVIAGKRGHVEIAGLTGDLAPGTFAVIERAQEVRDFSAPRIAVMAQTTAAESDVRAIAENVKQMNPTAEVRFVNTICRPTGDRQAALEKLLDKVDLLVVVGGRHSNNTHRLAARGREAGVRVIHIEAAEELLPEMFADAGTVGLTAGTSTPEETIAAVRNKLNDFAAG